MSVNTRHVLFDLDGTLTDSAEGITRCLEHAVLTLECVPPPRADLAAQIGTPLRDIFSLLLDTDERAKIERAVELYSERFDAVGYAENRVYPGVVDVLGELRARGYALYVATAKRQLDARRVIDHFELGRFFEGVFGVVHDPERADKSLLVKRILATHELEPASAAMVGDRSHDMLGARRARVRALGAGWGYGSSQELRESKAEAIAESPATLLEWLPAL